MTRAALQILYKQLSNGPSSGRFDILHLRNDHSIEVVEHKHSGYTAGLLLLRATLIALGVPIECIAPFTKDIFELGYAVFRVRRAIYVE